MSHLKQYVTSNRIIPFAMVYANACDGKGLEIFLSEMASLGVDVATLREGRHYEMNYAKTGALRPFTGEVWIRGDPTPDMLREIAPMLAERGSNPKYNDDMDMHTYNNPLFRESVRLGAWTWLGDFRPSLKAVNKDLPTRMVTRLIAEASALSSVAA